MLVSLRANILNLSLLVSWIEALQSVRTYNTNVRIRVNWKTVVRVVTVRCVLVTVFVCALRYLYLDICIIYI